MDSFVSSIQNKRMPKNKARNQVRKRNLLKMRNQTQVVNVVVKNTKTVRKREPKQNEPVMSRNRLLPPTPSVTVMNQQPDYRTLLSLLTATGRSPTPAQPSQGLINQPANVPQSQGLGRLLLQQAPRTPLAETSSDVISPKRDSTETTYQTPPLVPPNSAVTSSADLTTISKFLNQKERIRALLMANIDHVVPDKAIKKMIETRDKLSRLQERDELTKKIRDAQTERVNDARLDKTLIRLWQETREQMKRDGQVIKYPENTTPADFEDVNKPPRGLMGQIYDRFGGSARKPEDGKDDEDDIPTYNPKKLTYNSPEGGGAEGGGGKGDFTDDYWLDKK